MHLTFDPAILLLGIYPEDTPSIRQKYKCTRLFMAALFVIEKYWKKPEFPCMGRGLNN